ncbi:AMED_5909 family protein [Saccharothrix luteola]|uniref:AMED_5909 family protein n=1 Tax=Saccharothrix luteola TaxID=2893018 RepID=UPI0027E222B2|nr:AMED_5909 family protein [Saccharothrix luteola]
MTSLEELWSAVQSAATLRQAHDALLEVVPSREATRVEWRDFHQRAAEVYRRVAETDRGRQREALFLAEQQREKAEKIAQALAADAGARRRRRIEPGGPEGTAESVARVPHRVGDPRYAVRLRDDAFTKAVRLAGFHSDYALAKAMGLNRSTVKRARDGELRPGARFISGALKALAPFEFEDLFEVETSE